MVAGKAFVSSWGQWQFNTKIPYLPWAIYKSAHPDLPKTLTILDAACDPVNLADLLEEVAELDHKDLIILVNDKSWAETHRGLGFRYFPTWLWIAVDTMAPVLRDYPWSSQRKHKISCLNRMPRYHRLLLFYLIKQQSWAHQVLLSCTGLQGLERLQGDAITSAGLQALHPDLESWYMDHADEFPCSYQQDYQWENCHDATIDAYANCYLNIVTETSVDLFCPTEKTTKPLLAGTIPLFLASSDHVNELTNLGFDLDYEMISQPKDTDHRVRAQEIVQHVSEIIDSIQEIHWHNKHRIAHNQQWFYSADLRRNITNDVKEFS